MLPLPGPVTEGTHFEVILRDGVPIREAWKSFNKGCRSTRFFTEITGFIRATKPEEVDIFGCFW